MASSKQKRVAAPVFRPPVKTTVRVACAQFPARRWRDGDAFFAKVELFVKAAVRLSAEFVLFPEFFSLPLMVAGGRIGARAGIRRLARATPAWVERFGALARQYQLQIIAGTQPVLVGAKLYNTAFFFRPDGTHTAQRKLHLTPHERQHHDLTGGDFLSVIQTPKAKIGVLICYDVEFPETARHLADAGAEIIFVPYCTDTRHGHLRVTYCAQARAVENQLFVVTAGLVGRVTGVPEMDTHYARSGIYTPADTGFPRDAILAQAKANAETLLIADLDLARLRRHRAEGTVRPLADRRGDLFGFRHNLKS